MTTIKARPLQLLAGLILGLTAGVVTSGPLQQTLGTILQPVGSLWLDVFRPVGS